MAFIYIYIFFHEKVWKSWKNWNYLLKILVTVYSICYTRSPQQVVRLGNICSCEIWSENSCNFYSLFEWIIESIKPQIRIWMFNLGPYGQLGAVLKTIFGPIMSNFWRRFLILSWAKKSLIFFKKIVASTLKSFIISLYYF